MNLIKKFNLLNLLIGIFLIICIGNVYAEESKDFAVVVTKPKSGNSVSGNETILEGTASIPDKHHLWVFVRREDFEPFWWPQREAKIDENGNWKVTAVLGGQQDIGWKFDIGVMTFDEKGHTILFDYWKNAMKSGDWKPIEVPPISSPAQALLKVLKK